jgi:hypothetical protein
MYAHLFSSFPSTSMTYHNQYGDRLPKQGWSKWGGSVSGLLKEDLDTWYCQICGDEQVKTLPSYMIPVDSSNREFIRVCSNCKSKSYSHRVTLCWDLLRIVRVN